MYNTLNNDYKNKLEADLGLIEKSDVEIFYEKPCEWTLRKVSKQIQTIEMVELAVSNDGNSIRSVSKRLLSYDLCLKAIKQNGEALRYVPNKYLTEELCEIAVKMIGDAVQYVPREWITLNMAFDAVSNCRESECTYHDYPIYYIPESILNEDLVFESVRNSPLSLKNIPERFYSEELFLLAVSLNGFTL